MSNLHEKADRIDILLDTYSSYQAIMDVLDAQQTKLDLLKSRMMDKGQDLLMVVENELIALNLIGSRLDENRQRVSKELDAEDVMP